MSEAASLQTFFMPPIFYVRYVQVELFYVRYVQVEFFYVRYVQVEFFYARYVKLLELNNSLIFVVLHWAIIFKHSIWNFWNNQFIVK